MIFLYSCNSLNLVVKSRVRDLSDLGLFFWQEYFMGNMYLCIFLGGPSVIVIVTHYFARGLKLVIF